MKKWKRRLLISCFVLFLLLVLGVLGEWQIAVYAGRQRLNKIQAALDASEPGWRIHELNERRNAKLPPDDQNVTVLALKITDQIPPEFIDWHRRNPEDPRRDLKTNHFADPQAVAESRIQFEPIKPLVSQMHQIRKFPTGGNRIVILEPNPQDTLLNDTSKLRQTSDIMSWQVFLSTNDNDPDSSIEACRTQAHIRHAIGDEPMLISQLVRIAILALAIQNTERTLAMTVPKAGLPELQADFELALTETDFLRGLEGERAFGARILENMVEGKLSFKAIESNNGVAGQSRVPSQFESAIISRYGQDNQAKILEIMTAYRDATMKKGKERTEAYQSITKLITYSIPDIFVRLLCYSNIKVIEANVRIETKLATIIVGIACERYRQTNGKWPEKLSDIPKEILKEIPLDPYVGGPLKYKRNKTGIVIYSTGKDEIDDGGETLDEIGAKPKSDIGIQLFDPAHRRLPAEVKPKEFDVGPPPLPEPEMP